MKKYLAVSKYIDWDNAAIKESAEKLSFGLDNELEVIRRCFEFVRDEIRHTADYRLSPITCKASEVIKHKTGYCYAKSHLLAAPFLFYTNKGAG